MEMKASDAHFQAMVMFGQQEGEEEKKMKAPPQTEQALKCPRCDSTNTKFCYYNNYSLIQPRYFCKGCRRYWTHGGTLRNVPVGGGCRKNKRSLPTSPSDTNMYCNSSKKFPEKDHTFRPIVMDEHQAFFLGNPNPNIPRGFLEALRNGFAAETGNFNDEYLSFGVVGNGMVVEERSGMSMPIDGGMAGERKMMVGMQRHGGGDGSLSLENSGRVSYWNGVGGSFHGLINSSLM